MLLALRHDHVLLFIHLKCCLTLPSFACGNDILQHAVKTNTIDIAGSIVPPDL